MTDTSGPRHTPVQMRSAARRARILSAAREVVLEEGIDKTTTAKIAERAEASIGTVYRYWTDVHAILDEILPGRRQMHDVLLERAEQVAKGYTAEHDDEQGVPHLIIEALRRVQYRPVTREQLVEFNALALAALEAHDRQYGTVTQ